MRTQSAAHLQKHGPSTIAELLGKQIRDHERDDGVKWFLMAHR